MNEIAVVTQDKPLVKSGNSDLMIKTPIYIWKSGRTFFLSKKEKLVADTFIATRNYSECSRALKGMGVSRGYMTCMRWLNKGHIKEYMMEQFEEMGVASGWTLNHWMKVMTDHLSGVKRLMNGDLYAMNLIGKMKGWGVDGGGGTFNTQINFVERVV